MDQTKLKNITILFNKFGEQVFSDEMTEADKDTWDSAKEISNVLTRCGFAIDLLEIGKNELNKIKNIKADLIFNYIEWTGKDLDVALRAMEILEKLKIPFTGSGKFGYELSVDKRIMKEKMDEEKIPTPKWQIFETGAEMLKKDFTYPLIFKPIMEHCGIGIDQDSVVGNEKKARERINYLIQKYQQPVIAEEYIDGREINVTIFEKNGKPWVLPPAEIIFENPAGDLLPMFTYNAKWKDQTLEFKRIKAVRAELNENLINKIVKIAKKSYTVMGGRDYPRLDLRIRNEEVFVLEINNNPEIDFTSQGGIRVGTEAAGLTYEEAMTHIVKNAYKRGMRRNSYAAETALSY